MDRLKLKLTRINIVKAIFYVLLIGLIAYFYFPRSMANVAKLNKLRIEDLNEIHISIFSGTSQGDKVDYDFTTSEQIKELYELFTDTYVRKKILPKKRFDSSEFKGYYISVVTEQADYLPYIDLLTEDIIEINKVQYVFYGDDFSNEIDYLLNKY